MWSIISQRLKKALECDNEGNMEEEKELVEQRTEYHPKTPFPQCIQKCSV